MKCPHCGDHLDRHDEIADAFVVCFTCGRVWYKYATVFDEVRT